MTQPHKYDKNKKNPKIKLQKNICFNRKARVKWWLILDLPNVNSNK